MVYLLLMYSNRFPPTITHFGKITESDFVPPWWATNCHLQTIYPRFLMKRRKLVYRQQRLSLPDGDFVNLIWAGEVRHAKALIVLFHGLEGSIRSHYTNDMMANLVEEGYAAVLMHFRGCGGEANSHARAYHSGETEDAWFFLTWLILAGISGLFIEKYGE